MERILNFHPHLIKIIKSNLIKSSLGIDSAEELLDPIFYFIQIRKSSYSYQLYK